MKETLFGSLRGMRFQSKSVAEDPWLADQLVDDMCTLGMVKERVAMKSDQEVSIVELQIAVAKRGYGDHSVGAGVENSKVGDSDANGKIERAMLDVGNMVRTLRSTLTAR